MKRFLFLTTLLALFLLRATAQGTPADSVKSKIRDIKLSEKYLYAETASVTSMEEARAVALEELHIRVVEVLAGLGKEKAEMNSIWDKVGQSYAGLDYRNGPLSKVFLYIPKSMLTGEKETEEVPVTAEETPVTAVATGQPDVTTAEPVMPEQQPDQAAQQQTTGQLAVTEQQQATEQPEKANQPETAEQAVAEQPETESVIDPDLPAENSFTMNDDAGQPEKAEEETPNTETETTPQTPAEETTTESAAEPASVPVTEPETTTSEPTPQTETETRPEPTSAPETSAPVNPMDTMPDTHSRVVKDLLALDTYEGVMLYLTSMKEDGRLMYGRISTLVAPEQAYFIIIKDDRLLTVLNRGTKEHINLRTLQPEQLKKYKGHAIIWLKVF